MKMIIIGLTMILTGCATTPTPFSEARPTPDARIYFHSVGGPSTATAIFIRDNGFLGSGVYQHLSINGEKAAAIDVGEKATIRLLGGEYIFGVIPTDPFATQAEYTIDQKLEAGRTYTYRILIDGNTFSTRIQRVLGNATN